MTVKVNDRWVFLLLYPVIAFLSIHIGNDNTLPELLRLPSYYTDLIFAFVFTFAAGWYIRWISYRLERKFNWDTQLRQRLAYQITYGCLVPVVAIVAFEMIYLEFLLGLPISQSPIFYLELPLITVFCVLINLIYLMLYHRKHYFTATTDLIGQSKQGVHGLATPYKNNFVVHAGVKSINIPEAEVSYFMVQQKSTFVFTTDGRQYLYGASLGEIGKEVSPDGFFQLNRQIVAHRRSIVSCQRTDTRKLKIELYPEANVPVFVSKIKTPEFMRWLRQK